jgi:membrane-associated phospholipid phosphatase
MPTPTHSYRFCCSLLVAATLSAGTPAFAQMAPASTSPRPAPGVVSPVPGVGDLLTDTVSSFRQLPSRDTLSWITFGAAAAALAHTVDGRVTSGMSGSRIWGERLGAGETLGSARLQFGAALATYVAGRATRNDRLSLVGGDLVRSQLLVQTLTAGIKMSVRRGRPDGTQFSFPSGHSATAFATATVLQRDLGWKFGVPAYALASYVAASRVQVKRHFLSDVTLGAALGIVAGRTVTIGRGEHRFAVAPMAAPGGAGVSFTLLGAK